MKGQRCDEASQNSSFCTAKSVVRVIVIDDSDSSEAASAVDASMIPVGMSDGALGPFLVVSLDIDTSGRAGLKECLM